MSERGGNGPDRYPPNGSLVGAAAVRRRRKRYRRASLVLFVLPFALLLLVGVIVSNATLVEAGVCGVVIFAISTQILVAGLVETGRSETRDSTSPRYRHVSRAAAMEFFGVTTVFGLTLVIPSRIIFATPHPIANKIVLLIVIVFGALLVYRTYERGLVERQTNSIRIHYLFRNQSVCLDQISGIELVESSFPVTSVTVGLRLETGKLLPVPNLRFHWRDLRDVKGDVAVIREVDRLTLMIDRQN